jgi:hypothetical protein
MSGDRAKREIVTGDKAIGSRRTLSKESGDEDYDSDKVAQIRHFNSQATSILLASLCRE